MQSAECKMKNFPAILLAIIAFGGNILWAQDPECDDPKPDPTQDIYRRIKLPVDYCYIDQQDRPESIIYDSSDFSDLPADRLEMLKKVMAENKVDFDDEFLFIVNLSAVERDFKNNLSSLLENDSTLIFALHFDIPWMSSGRKSRDFNFCFAIKKNRVNQVFVERTWFQRSLHNLKSYVLRQYKDELSQPIR